MLAIDFAEIFCIISASAEVFVIKDNNIQHKKKKIIKCML